MDANSHALAHVQNALLQALCATHPSPNHLNEAFEHFLQRTQEVLEANQEMIGRMSTWARTFRDHIPIAEPDTG